MTENPKLFVHSSLFIAPWRPNQPYRAKMYMIVIPPYFHFKPMLDHEKRFCNKLFLIWNKVFESD